MNIWKRLFKKQLLMKKRGATEEELLNELQKYRDDTKELDYLRQEIARAVESGEGQALLLKGFAELAADKQKKQA